MRWFKHHASLRNTEGVAKILDKGGIEAYGAFCMMCELIAEHMGPTDLECTLTLPRGRWAKELGIHPNTVGRLLSIMQASAMCTITMEKENIRVAIPKLAIWRDEYSRKSGQAPDTRRTISHRSESESESESEKEGEKEKESKGDGDRGLGKGEGGGFRNLLPKVETDEDRKEFEIRKRNPHLAHTSDFESFGEINRKSKRESMRGGS